MQNNIRMLIEIETKLPSKQVVLNTIVYQQKIEVGSMKEESIIHKSTNTFEKGEDQELDDILQLSSNLIYESLKLNGEKFGC